MMAVKVNLAGATFFYELDFTHSFFQLPLWPGIRPYTSFAASQQHNFNIV